LTPIFTTPSLNSSRDPTIYQSVVRIFRSEPGPVDSNEVLLVAYTGMAAHNIGGMTAHSAFSLSANQGSTTLGLSSDKANTLACKLRRLKLIVIDEVSLISAEHMNQISLHLKQIFRSELEFAGRSVIVVGDFAQIRPVGGQYAFASQNAHHRNSVAVLVDNPQWSLFSIFELTEIMRQKNDLQFAEALSRLAVGATTQQDNALFESRCFNDETLPTEARTSLRLIFTNTSVDQFNLMRARQLTSEGAMRVVHHAVDKFIGNVTEKQKRQALHNLKKLDKKNTQNLVAELQLGIGLRYMVSTNIDVSDGLFNGASGVLRLIEIQNQKINGVYIEFDDPKIGANARSSRYGIISSNQLPETWTPIKKIKKSFYTTKKGTVQINREQLPLLMAEAITIHKSQGRSEKIVTVDLRGGVTRQVLYVALSRATSLSGLHILGKFKPPEKIKDNNPVKLELERLRRQPLIPKYQFLRTVPDTCHQIVSFNVQSIRKHLATVIADSVFSTSLLILLQESWAIDTENYEIPNFDEISRNQLHGQPKAFGTINFVKSSMASRLTNKVELEESEGSGHVELTVFQFDNLTIVNVYNSPSSNMNLLKVALEKIQSLISESTNVLILGDFNQKLHPENPLERYLRKFDLDLISPRAATTNAGTTIDGVFAKIVDYKVECHIYESYASFHKPLITRIQME
jgi:hypothetical protein